MQGHSSGDNRFPNRPSSNLRHVDNHDFKKQENQENTNGSGNANSLRQIIYKTVATKTQEVIATAQRRRRNGWFEDQCQRVRNDKNAARSQILAAGTRLNMKRYKVARAEEKQIHYWSKKWWHEQNVVAESKDRIDMQRFYVTVNVARYKNALVWSCAMIGDDIC